MSAPTALTPATTPVEVETKGMPDALRLLAVENETVGLYLLGKADCPPCLKLLRGLVPDVAAYCEIVDFNRGLVRLQQMYAQTLNDAVASFTQATEVAKQSATTMKDLKDAIAAARREVRYGTSKKERDENFAARQYDRQTAAVAALRPRRLRR